MNSVKKVKVRVAPSPTGLLHVGTAQSALYNWLFARKNGGEFYLRIEDTDRVRSTKEAEENIVEGLKWLGLNWNGEVSHSSHNQPRYRELLEQLLKEGKAFYCYHTQKELEAERRQQEADKEAPRHICKYKYDERRTTEFLGGLKHRQETTPNTNDERRGVIRLAVDEGSDRVIIFDDQIRGKIEFKQSLLGDFSIARSLDDALYHFAVVVDDIDMDITHVLRGEDHISNTPKQILIYEALGKDVPEFAHLPLLLAPDRSKLSKRHGVVSISEYKKDYVPDAIVNFLGVLGYTFNKEIISREEMVMEFDLAKVHKSGAVFDIKKLNWINSQWIKKMSSNEFKNKVGIDMPDEAVPFVTERLEKLSNVESFDYFWSEPKFDKELLRWKKADLKKSIATLGEVRKMIEDFDFKKGKDELRKILDELSVKIGDRGLVYWPLRVALTGKDKSPDPVDIAFVLGKEETSKRIGKAAD